MRPTGAESPSAQKALALIREKTRAGPWESSIPEAAREAGIPVRTFHWAVRSLQATGAVSATAVSGNKTRFAIGNVGNEVGNVGNEIGNENDRSAMKSATILARSFQKPNDLETSAFVSSSILTTNEASKLLGETARGSATSASNVGNEIGNFADALMDRNERLARENGRLEAENAYLRERLARLETPCPATPVPLPIPSTSAPSAGTRGSATTSHASGPTERSPRSSGTSSEGTWTPTVTPTAPAIEPRPSAPPSPRPVATTPVVLHPANYRGETLTPLEPGTDPHEDERVFREMICKDAGVTSEMAQDVELMRLRKDFPTFHRAVASYVLAVARKDKPRKPLGYLATSVGLGAVPGGFGEEGAVATWEEINKTWLPKARANPKKRSAAEEKAEAERLAAEDQARCVAIVAKKRAEEAERERKLTEQWAEEDRIRAELEAKNKARLVAQFTGEAGK